MCGAEYTIAAGNQRFCPRCSRVPSAIKRTVEPSRRKPRRLKPHRKTIRDDLDCVPSTFRDLLDRYDITQSRFAEYFGLDVSTVSRWCSGEIVCRPYIIAMAAKILSLAADEVRGDAENCKNEEDPT
jgi:DNA-binding transcriptional regulator YiaG